MKVAISFFGTGKYLDYLPRWYEKVEENFFPGVQKQILVFTDGEIEDTPENISIYQIEHKSWPYITLERFESLLLAKEELQNYDWFVFLDADALVVDTITKEEFFDDNPYVGVHHPCHFLEMPPHNKFPGSFETNQSSTASVSKDDDLSVYFQGCLWGGKIPEVIEMIESLDKNIQDDLSRDIIAKWHDESHLNHFYINKKDKVKVLGPEYAYPEVFSEYCEFDPKIVHLAKDNSKYHK